MTELRHIDKCVITDKDTKLSTIEWWCGAPTTRNIFIASDSMPGPASVETCPECVKAKADSD